LCYNECKLTQNARGGRSESSIKQFRRRGGAVLKCLIALALIVATATSVKVLADVIASFTVAEPDKTVNVNRGNSVDDTSTVNVSDPDATDGYIIKAKLTADISADFAVYIWSDDSILCTESNKCQLSTTDKLVYVNMTDSATINSGDAISFDVSIYSSSAAAIDTHDVDIEYTKQNVSFMHQFSTAKCQMMSLYPDPGSEVDLIDARDLKTYKIRRLADQNCWMVDNLALDGSQTLESTLSEIGSGTTYALGTVGSPNGEAYCANLDLAIYPHKCGNHYSWTVATTGGTTDYSICPKNWRLPAYTEYITLQTDLDWGSSSGDNIVDSAWRGLYAGYGTSARVGLYGYYLSATSATSINARVLVFTEDSVSPSSSVAKSDTRSVRCLAK
jgi:uncharacterized protein (TIGR02145 family)